MTTKKQPTKKTKVAAAKKVTKKPANKKTKVALASKKTATKIKRAKTVKKTKTIGLSKPSSVKKVAHKKKCSAKRVAYFVLSMAFALLVGTFVHLFLELVYLKNAFNQDMGLRFHRVAGIYSYLPTSIEILIMLASVLFGLWLNSWGWRTVYVEHKHRMFKKA